MMDINSSLGTDFIRGPREWETLGKGAIPTIRMCPEDDVLPLHGAGVDSEGLGNSARFLPSLLL